MQQLLTALLCVSCNRHRGVSRTARPLCTLGTAATAVHWTGFQTLQNAHSLENVMIGYRVLALLAVGGDGIVHTWDLRTQRCIDRSVDEGCVRGTSLACSADLFATGSDAGVVNIHRRQPAAKGATCGGAAKLCAAFV